MAGRMQRGFCHRLPGSRRRHPLPFSDPGSGLRDCSDPLQKRVPWPTGRPGVPIGAPIDHTLRHRLLLSVAGVATVKSIPSGKGCSDRPRACPAGEHPLDEIPRHRSRPTGKHRHPLDHLLPEYRRVRRPRFRRRGYLLLARGSGVHGIGSTSISDLAWALGSGKIDRAWRMDMGVNLGNE